MTKAKTQAGKKAAGQIRVAPAPQKDDYLRLYLSEHPDYEVPPSKATKNKLQSWLTDVEDHARASARVAYLVGRALLASRKEEMRGNISLWTAEQASKLNRAARTLRLYMQVAKAIDDDLATPLPISILDRPLREVPGAIRNVREGLPPDAPRPKKVSNSPDALDRWLHDGRRVVMAISSLPVDVRSQALLDLLACVMDAAKKQVPTKDFKNFMTGARRNFRNPKSKLTSDDSPDHIKELFGVKEQEDNDGDE